MPEANELELTQVYNISWLYVVRGNGFRFQNNINIDQCELINSRIYGDKLLMKRKLSSQLAKWWRSSTAQYLVNCLLSSWTSISRLLNSFSSLRIAAWGGRHTLTHIHKDMDDICRPGTCMHFYSFCNNTCIISLQVGKMNFRYKIWSATYTIWSKVYSVYCFSWFILG